MVPLKQIAVIKLKTLRNQLNQIKTKVILIIRITYYRIYNQNQSNFFISYYNLMVYKP